MQCSISDRLSFGNDLDWLLTLLVFIFERTPVFPGNAADYNVRLDKDTFIFTDSRLLSKTENTEHLIGWLLRSTLKGHA